MHDCNVAADAVQNLSSWIESRLIGRDLLIERLLTGLLTGGHVLD